MPRFPSILLIALGLFISNSRIIAQEPEPNNPPDRNQAAIEALIPLIEREETQLAELRKLLPKQSIPQEKAETEASISQARARLKELRLSIRSLATGVGEEEWTGEETSERTLNDEIQDIIRPIVAEMRDATSGAREISTLKEEISRWENRLAMAERAIARLQQLPEKKNPQLSSEIQKVQNLWSDRHSVAKGELQALRARLADRQAQDGGVFQNLSSAITRFWQSRGLNLLLALGSFAITIYLGHHLRKWLAKFKPLSLKGSSAVPGRILELTANAVVILTAFLSALLVLYLRGDWLLLSIFAVLLVAAAIASRNILVPYAEQVRTLLNLGNVREGERLVLNGIPWRLDTLGVYCQFSNPMLDGGLLRLHVRELSKHHSRPSAPKEPWFPTATDEWVVLADGTFGKIVRQTPELVTVLQLGGSRKTYPTTEFLTLAPENLSHGYRVTSRFGIDYKHQSEAVSKVAPLLAEAVQRRLLEIIAKDDIHSIKVEFAEANSSSLDFIVLADLKGEAARHRNALPRLIQAACLIASNENGWTIPFPQLTLHQALPS